LFGLGEGESKWSWAGHSDWGGKGQWGKEVGSGSAEKGESKCASVKQGGKENDDSTAIEGWAKMGALANQSAP